MMKEIGMPKFGLSMETGIIAAWLVKEGDKVEAGQALAEINSEKLSNVCEAPEAGYIRKILASVDDELECGTTICILADSMDADISGVGGASAAAAPAAPAAAAPAAAPAAPVAAAPAAAQAKEVRITPRAKKYAEEKGLVYDHITGTGIGGSITIDDVKKFGKSAAEAAAAAEAPAAAPAYVAPADVKITRRAKAVAERKGWAYGHIKGSGEGGVITVSDLKRYGKPYGEVELPAAEAVSTGYDSTKPDVVRKMTPMELAVCKGMMNSLSGTAQTTLTTEADISSLVSLYQSIKGKYNAAGIKLSYTAIIIKAVAMAMENHPDMRVSLVDEKTVRIAKNIDIGCAVDVPGGLIVPVIRNANMKDLRTISLELLELTEKAKAGKLTADNMGGACITITNLGMFGITYFTPVLNSPESLILGVGSIFKKVIIRNGVMTPASVINFSLTHDHRVTNGAPVARFLHEVVESLKDFKWL